MVDVWRTSVLRQLQEKNKFTNALKELIDRNNSLLTLQDSLHAETVTLQHSKIILETRLHDLENEAIGVLNVSKVLRPNIPVKAPEDDEKKQMEETIVKLTNEMAEKDKSIQHLLSETKQLHSSPKPKPDLSSFIPRENAKIPQGSKKFFQVDQVETNCIAFSPSGTIFGTGGTDCIIKVWDNTGTKKQHLMGSEKAVMSVAFSPDEEFVIGCSSDRVARIWSTKSTKIQHWLSGHFDKVYTAQFFQDSKKAITGSLDRTLKIWDLQKSFCIRTIFGYSACNHVAVHFSGSIAVSGHADHNLRFWDTRNGDNLYHLTGIHTGQVTSVTFSPDGNTLLTNSRDNSLKLVDLRTYKVLRTFFHDNFQNSTNWSRACFSSDGNYISAGTNSGSVYIWNTFSGTRDFRLTDILHKNPVTCVTWNPNGYQVGTCDRTGWAALWE